MKNCSYAEPNKFNKTPFEIEEDEEPEIDIDTKGLKFNFDFTRYIYNKAKDHFDTHKHGLERIVHLDMFT